MKDRGRTIVLLVMTAALFVFVSVQVLGPSGSEADDEACDLYWDSDVPFYAAGTVSVDEGMKAFGKRALRAARIADDADLKGALMRFSEAARSKTWDDSEAETAEKLAAAVLGLCPN